MQREQPPSWLGPATTVLVILVLAGLGVLIWMTVYADDEGEEEHSEPAGFHLSYSDLHTA